MTMVLIMDCFRYISAGRVAVAEGLAAGVTAAPFWYKLTVSCAALCVRFGIWPLRLGFSLTPLIIYSNRQSISVQLCNWKLCCPSVWINALYVLGCCEVRIGRPSG